MFSTLPLTKTALALASLAMGAGAFAASDTTMHVLIGTYSPDGHAHGIHAAAFDAQTGKLSDDREVASLVDPSFIALSADGKHLYATGVEHGEGFVHAFAVGGKGALTLLNSQKNSKGGDCHLSLSNDEKTVLAANYGHGSVSAFPVQGNGSLGERSFFAQHSGTGPNHGRQEAAHAHAFTAAPKGDFAFAPDLGTDTLYAYRLSGKAGEVTAAPKNNVSSVAGHGPRHITFTPDARFAYEIDELVGAVRAYRYEASTGELSFLEEVSTLPKGYTGKASGAEIFVHSSGKFLYASNREDHQSVAVFSIGADGKLTWVQHFQPGLVHPRFIGQDPSGHWLFVTNTFGNSIVVAPIDQGTGKIGAVVSKLEVPSPSCVVFLK